MARRALKKVKKAAIWWWQLPRWIKLGKFALILMLVLAIPAMNAVRQWQTYHQVYDQYYEHFYESYVRSIPQYQAKHLANYYADFYASYYSSADFRRSMRYALPSATPETTTYPTDSPNASLQITEHGLTLIQGFEGLRLTPYYDAGGKLTIGYGHLIKPGEFYAQITGEEANALLRKDIQVAEAYVKRYVETPLNYQQFSALVSLVYNIGPGQFQRSSMLIALNEGNTERAAKEFLRWDRVGYERLEGLSRRRKAEKALFEG